jgi:hypothetical protein
MRTIRYSLSLVAICAVTVAFAGCGSQMAKVSQGLTPIVVNFYVVNQDLDRARQAVKDNVPAQADDQLKAYNEVIAHLQTMAGDLARDPELKKKPELLAMLDSCIAADTIFLNLEAAAVGCRAASARLGQQINDIEQRSRGNTIKARQYQGELNTLESQRRQQQAALGGLLPRVTGAAAQCRALLVRYNGFAASAKLISYFNNDTIFEPFGWEQAASSHAKPAAKARHKTAAKPRRLKR